MLAGYPGVALALRTVGASSVGGGGALLDASSGFPRASAYQAMTAEQALRFMDSEVREA